MRTNLRDIGVGNWELGIWDLGIGGPRYRPHGKKWLRHRIRSGINFTVWQDMGMGKRLQMV